MNGPMWFLLIFGAIWFATRFGGGCGRSRRDLQNTRPEVSSRMSDRIEELSSRLERLEEERDFYRELLGSGTRFRRDGEVATPRPETSGERVT